MRWYMQSALLRARYRECFINGSSHLDRNRCASARPGVPPSRTVRGCLWLSWPGCGTRKGGDLNPLLPGNSWNLVEKCVKKLVSTRSVSQAVMGSYNRVPSLFAVRNIPQPGIQLWTLRDFQGVQKLYDMLPPWFCMSQRNYFNPLQRVPFWDCWRQSAHGMLCPGLFVSPYKFMLLNAHVFLLNGIRDGPRWDPSSKSQ